MEKYIPVKLGISYVKVVVLIFMRREINMKVNGMMIRDMEEVI